VIGVVHFRTDDPGFPARAERALASLATRPGYVRGQLGRSVDDRADWVLLTEWADVGSYRRALGSYDVKVHATPLLTEAREVPGSFESLIEVDADGAVAVRDSDREPEA